jgi:hypothetical protein
MIVIARCVRRSPSKYTHVRTAPRGPAATVVLGPVDETGHELGTMRATSQDARNDQSDRVIRLADGSAS